MGTSQHTGDMEKTPICLILCLFTSLDVATSWSAGWFDGNPYNLGCIQFNASTALTWNSAQEFCHTQESSNLVEIFTQEQQNFLVLMAEQVEAITQTKRHWLIGITDVASEGEWIWPHSLKVADYTAWNSGQPNGGPNYNYAIMNNAMGYKWDDQPDTSAFFPICQKL